MAFPAAMACSKTRETQTGVMAESQVKYDWYQTETHVVIEVRIKSLHPESVQVQIQPTQLSVTTPIPDRAGADFVLDLELAHPIVPASSNFKVLASKLEVKLAKKTGQRWSSLQGDGTDTLTSTAGGAEATPTNPSKYPSSSGKDWSKIESEILKELDDEKPEGEAALNSMFQKIYSEGSDEVKKAMNKSFSESGGTVLSTNWQDIAKDKVDVKAPDGMEYKKWDD
eukprot:snap_masked-scaffold121_size336169-processed-gene-2.22 protein:Tk01644 transcript:snap_masked-scaffold121_size336169-processed-gene-2.22-mRNA-1 annotation:"suppressor of g2 allele of skp1-like protein"